MLHCTWLEKLARDKDFSLLGSFIIKKEIEVLSGCTVGKLARDNQFSLLGSF